MFFFEVLCLANSQRYKYILFLITALVLFPTNVGIFFGKSNSSTKNTLNCIGRLFAP